MKKIVIIEDDSAMQNALKGAFEDAGFTVEAYSDCTTCISEMRNVIPNHILLDLMLPGKEGLSVLEELRADDKLNGVPVTILTNSDSSEDLAKAMEFGTFDYLVKAQHSTEEIVTHIKDKLG